LNIHTQDNGVDIELEVEGCCQEGVSWEGELAALELVVGNRASIKAIGFSFIPGRSGCTTTIMSARGERENMPWVGISEISHRLC
jgi:hypothetical protein